MNVPSPRFMGLFIPAEIWEIEGLTLFEIMLLAWVDALFCKNHGGCFASNKYLSEKMKGVKENTVAKSLTKLRARGLIVDVSFNGRMRVMRACIGRVVEEAQSEPRVGFKSKQGWTKIQPSVGRKSNVSYKEEIQVEIQDKVATPAASPPPPAAVAFVTAFFVRLKNKNPGQKKPNLENWAREADRMIRIDNRSYPQAFKILDWADEQSDDFWPIALQSPKTLRKLFDRAVLKMKHKSKAEKQLSEEEERDKRCQENRKWAQFLSKLSFPIEGQYIKREEFGVCIMMGRERTPFGYSEPTFRKVILNKLRNWGIPHEKNM